MYLISNPLADKFSMSDETHDKVLFEGNLGELEELGMVEDIILEIKGANGIMRVDLTEEELRKMLSASAKKVK